MTKKPTTEQELFSQKIPDTVLLALKASSAIVPPTMTMDRLAFRQQLFTVLDLLSCPLPPDGGSAGAVLESMSQIIEHPLVCKNTTVASKKEKEGEGVQSQLRYIHALLKQILGELYVEEKCAPPVLAYVREQDSAHREQGIARKTLQEFLLQQWMQTHQNASEEDPWAKDLLDILDRIVLRRHREQNTSPEEVVQTYQLLEKSLVDASKFWARMFDVVALPVNLKEEIDQLTRQVKSAKKHVTGQCSNPKEQEIHRIMYAFVKKAAAFSTMPDAPMRCAYLKVVRAFMHLHGHQHVLEQIAESTTQLQDALFAPEKTPDTEGPWKKRRVPVRHQRIIEIKLSSRPKDKDRLTLKLVEKPDCDLTREAKDLMGIRIEVDPENFPEILEYLKSKLWETTVDNTSLEARIRNMPSELVPELQQALLGIPTELSKKPKKTTNESAEQDDFRAVYITGQWPKEAQEHRKKTYVNFEIQCVPVGNSNESGLLAHPIYEAATIVRVLVRQFGYVKQEWLNKLAVRAYDATIDEQEACREIEKREMQKFAERGMRRPPKIGTKAIGQLYRRFKDERIKAIYAKITERLIPISPNTFTTAQELDKLHSLGILPSRLRPILEEHKIVVFQHSVERWMEKGPSKAPEEERQQFFESYLRRGIEEKSHWDHPIPEDYIPQPGKHIPHSRPITGE